MTGPIAKPACPKCRSGWIRKRYQDHPAECRACGHRFDIPIAKPMKGSGIITPRTYRQQIAREWLGYAERKE
jgi:predicted Zn-ribbon and HTH transcriptional regulator